MASPFSLTQRSLQADRSRTSLVVLLVGLAVLGLWITWLFAARVQVYEVSDSARLETALKPHRVGATAEGRIEKIDVSLGDVVAANTPLLEIDCRPEKLRLAEEQRRRDSLKAQMSASEVQVAALQQAITGDVRVAKLEADEAKANYEEQRAQAQLNGELAKRSRQLSKRGLIPGVQDLGAQTRAKSSSSATRALHFKIRRLTQASAVQRQEQRASLQKLLGAVAALKGQIAATEVAIAQMKQLIDEHTIRAPVAGRVDWIADLQVGSVVKEGDMVAIVIPRGPLKVVAQFAPSALGRLARGQRARVRLDGFSWIEYGYLRATVTTVSAETVDGKARVELALTGENHAIPVQHGLPGQVEVVVEHISPAELLLRTVGAHI